jgi:hypothetical protein
MTMRHLSVIVLLLLAPASPLLGQGTDTSAAVSAAQAAAEPWLHHLDRQQYAQTWDSAAAAFRSAVSKADWKAAVVQAREPYEPFGARKLIASQFATTLPNAPPGQYVILQYETAVAGKRTVIETVTPKRESNGVARGRLLRPAQVGPPAA